jgi:hypothetical protein
MLTLGGLCFYPANNIADTKLLLHTSYVEASGQTT